MRDDPRGIAAVIAAGALWGAFPLYFNLMGGVSPVEIVVHRILWTVLAFAALLAVRGQLWQVRALLAGPDRGRAVAAAFFILINWSLYIWAVTGGHAIESSLGYYIFPLVAVLFGVLFRGERLDRWSGAAVGLALLGVLVLTFGLGVPPWVALTLATSFAAYGLLKGRINAPAEVTVTVEALVLLPLALILLGVLAVTGWAGDLAFGDSVGVTALLVVTGVVTGVPLILFTWGSRRVRMSTLGMMQYLNPTMQAVIAITVLNEPLTRWHLIAFALIWAGLAIYSAAAVVRDRGQRRVVP